MTRFCTLCGEATALSTPDGDNRPRLVCTTCKHIHYENPRLIVGCVAEWDGRILLCRRAIEPRCGFWTLPAGFMENAETTEQAAWRETYEEAGADVRLDAPFAMFSIAHINQVHLFYRGHLRNDHYLAGTESLEVRLFEAEEIPWADLSFASVAQCLQLYLQDRQNACFQFHDRQQQHLLHEAS